MADSASVIGELERRDTLMRLAVAAARMGTWANELATRTVHWSPELERIFGMEPGSFEGTEAAFFARIHPADRAMVARAVAQAIESRTDYSVEFRFRHQSGSWRWMDGRGKGTYDRSGKVLSIYGVGIDITDNKLAEQALHDEARVLETLNRVGKAVVAELDLDRAVQTVTDAATELSGAAFGAFFYNVRNVTGESYLLYTLSGAPREAFSKFPMPRNTAVFGPTFLGSGVVRSDDITADPRYGLNEPYHGMPPGHLPVASYLAVPVVSRSGEVIGGLFFGHPNRGIFDERAERLVAGIASQAAIAIDNARLYQAAQMEIEARTAAEAALRESEANARALAADRERLLQSERAARSEAERLSHLKDEFLATLSHELRTPLHAIQGWSEILRKQELPEDERARAADAIHRNSRAQTQIINDLLDMSRIVSGKIALEVQSVELQELIAAAVESVRPSAKARQIRIRTLLDATIGPIRGDPNRLQQVIWNLLTNAVKFTPRGGRIQVVLERRDSHIELLVEDTGVGIEPAFLPHVFDRFRQADASTTRVHGGLGLGLSIVKTLVELHGGSVRVRSAGPDQGTTFSVELPVSVMRLDETDEHRTLRTESPPELVELPKLDGFTILVVDDEPDSRALVARLVEDRGARAIPVPDAIQALEAMARGGIDLIVSDIGMPRIDGYELIRRMRESDARRVPAIALTAYARAEDRQRSLLAGYQMHIAKPVEPRELIAAIASLLKIR